MGLATIGKQLERFVRDNSPEILTAIGVTGTITTAILTHRAALHANHLIRMEENERELQELGRAVDFRDRVNLIWRCYIPPVGVGLLTIGAIIGVNRIGTKRAAAIAAAYSIMENSFDEYREKVVEKLGENKERAVRDEIAQEQINRNPVSNSEVIACLGAMVGEVLCYDSYTGRYFTSSMEEIKKAQNEINYQIIHHNYASLADFYILIGLPVTLVSEEVGWNTDQLLDIQFSTCLTDDDRPCISIKFNVQPVRGYHQGL